MANKIATGNVNMFSVNPDQYFEIKYSNLPKEVVDAIMIGIEEITIGRQMRRVDYENNSSFFITVSVEDTTPIHNIVKEYIGVPENNQADDVVKMPVINTIGRSVEYKANDGIIVINRFENGGTLQQKIMNI